MTTRRIAWPLVTLCAGLVGLTAPAARADTMTFSKGALIIPMQSTFQPQGGMLSAYGLIYRILLSNQPGHRNAGHPVTVYIVNDSSKTSPNRCIPSNKSSYSSSAMGSGTVTAWNGATAKQNDGCDVVITNSTEQPVVPVDYSKDLPAGGYPDAEVNTFDDSKAWPRYTTAKLTTANGFTTVRYLGGPFVIDAADAKNVIDLIRNGDTGAEAPPKAAIDLFSDAQRGPPASAYENATSVSTGSYHCTAFGISTATTTAGGVSYSSGCHYVYMHQATTAFTANVSRRINRAPAPFALYESDLNGRGGPLGSVGILDKYLKVAGLYVAGSTNGADTRGCPVGARTRYTSGSTATSFSVASSGGKGCFFNGSTCAAGTSCPASAAKHGVIYDYFETPDIDDTTTAGGPLNQKAAVGSSLVYHLFWAPHWEAKSDGWGNDGNGASSIVSYVNSGGNLMTECVSINIYENGVGTIGGPANSANFLFTNKINFNYIGSYVSPSGSGLGSDNTSFAGLNCSDPAATSSCAGFPHPGNVFAQIGDWKFARDQGYNEGFAPASGSALQGWTQEMVTATDGNSDGTVDQFDMGQQDQNHGTVVYVAGHDVSGSPVGSRIVLNSMLNLDGDPITSERALSAPVVAYSNAPNLPTFVDELINGTFDAVTGYSSNPAVENFDPINAKLWVFPYYPGDFRAHDLSAIPGGESPLATASTWDAASMPPSGMAPLPAQRNLFTYFGGYPKLNPSLAGGSKPPHGVLQWGWTPEVVDGSQLTSIVPKGTSCVDVMGINVSSLTSTTTYDDCENTDDNCAGDKLHLVVGADGLCDLQEGANFSKINSGNDWDTLTAHNMATFLVDVPNVKTLLYRVRGYCFAGVLGAIPGSDSACVDGRDNRAHLGGVVHATPAVVGPSPNVPDDTAPRPTVAYVGGLDGQLHAFFVGGGKGYKGPSGALNFPYANLATDAAHDASKKFYKDWASDFAAGSTPTPGTELWSYIPATQLPHLGDNSASVDSSPVVMDVFADFGGTGLREWHTVLVESLGKNATELFAMDITDPLKPRLLWDIVGSLVKAGSGPYYSPTEILSDGMTFKKSNSPSYPSCTPDGDKNQSSLPGSCDVPKWSEESALFLPYPATDDGRSMTKVYDYQDLGGSAGLALAEARVGLEPYYLLYAATNMPPGQKGIEVFAIDVATGQRVWQWEHLYDHLDPKPPDKDNEVPPVVSVMYGQDGAKRLLVGDFEGRLWELDALTGVNVNVTTSGLGGCTKAAPCRFPAFDAFYASGHTASQPITTNIAVATIPPAGGANALSAYAGATVVLFGTAGSDAISSPDTTAGQLHLLLYDDAYRVPIYTGTGGKNLSAAGVAFTPASAGAAATGDGVLQEPAPFPDVLAAGERLYGAISVAGDSVFFSSAQGSVGDIMTVSAGTGGHTYRIQLGSVPSAGSPHFVYSDATHANYGGLALYQPSAGSGVTPVGAEVSSLWSPGSTGANVSSKPDPSLSPVKPSMTYRLRNWILRFLQ